VRHGRSRELKVGCYALWGGKIVRVDAIDGGAATVEVQGATLSGSLVDLGQESCGVDDLIPLDV